MSDHAIFGHVILLAQVQAAGRAVLHTAANLFDLHTGNAVGISLNVRVNRRVD